jgi:phage terminase large subunit
MQVVGAIKQEWDVTPFANRPYDICVDALGPGSGVASRLRELNLPARDINVSESPALKGQYANLRSELWFKCREWFEGRNVSIPPDFELIEDLALPAYRYLPSGKIFVQGKAKRLEDFKGMTRSPDAADALCLTFASSAATALYGGKYSRTEAIKRGLKGTV